MELPCISIQQPLADLVFAPSRKRKRIENRGWKFGHRGWLAIHASSNRTRWNEMDERRQQRHLTLFGETRVRLGCVIGVVRFDDVRRYRQLPARLKKHPHAGKHSANWCWILANPVPLAAPVPWPGNAGVFYVDVEVPGLCDEPAVQRG